jgi:tetratricopeptide (TPR) repeat protein
MYVYGSPQGYALKESEKTEITKTAFEVFLSKCEDRNADMKDVRKAYKAYKKALKISDKAYIVCEESFFNSFKEDYYEDISKEQQKEVEAGYRAFIRGIKVRNRTSEVVADALYKLANADRNYYKVKKADADYRIDKAKKRVDEISKTLDDIRADTNVVFDLYIAKAKAIGKGDNIFTRVEKHQEANK